MESLARIRALVAEDLARVEGLMAEALSSRADTITAAADHLLGSGGKKVRALLTLLAARASGFAVEQAHVLACAGELIHAASLCHDDVLDRGEMRRGRPTTRVVFGEPMAILLGDYCVVRAFEVVSRAGLSSAATALARAVVAMAEGEVMQAQRLGRPDAGVGDYFATVDLKTGALLQWCSSLGGLAPEPSGPVLSEYGRLFGRVYQIADDLLDLDLAGGSGKRVGQDLRTGERTLPVVLACARRRGLAERLRPAGEATDVEALLAAIRATGALEEAREVAAAEAERAVETIQALPAGPYTDALADLVRFAARRTV